MTPHLRFRLLAFVALLASAFGFTSCDSEAPGLGLSQVQQPDYSPEVGRAVFVYMLADNSLGNDGYDRDNLADMIEAAKDGRLAGNRLIVYHDDAMEERPALKEVTPYGLRILKYYDNSEPSVSSARMREAIADFKGYAPARRYGLVLWSHASGWPQNGMADAYGISPMSFGEDRGASMNVTTLARVLSGQGFDYVYFDCCHMASVEALYELREVAGLFAGSCAELPAEGMPYYDALPYLMADDADLVGAASTTFSKYDGLTGVSRTATMSVIDSSGLERLAEATRTLYELHPQLPAAYPGQKFERPKTNGEPCYLFDFEDYVTALYSSSSSREMRRAYADWLLALDDCVLYQAATPYIFNTIRVDSHCGLTTYIIRSEVDADVRNYRQLGWYSDVASSLFIPAES